VLRRGRQLFVWRMSSFYRELHGDGEEAGMWFTYALAMAGMGLVSGLLNTILYFRISKGYRDLKVYLNRRFRR
jgi:hypothetical protein